MSEAAHSAATTVWIVEDDPDNLQAVASVLRSEGYEVFAAQSAAPVLERLRRGERPDLMVLDFWLGEASARDLLAELPGIGAGGVPVLLISGDDRAVDELLDSPRECVELVRKPLELEELLAAVARASAASRPRVPPAQPGGEVAAVQDLAPVHTGSHAALLARAGEILAQSLEADSTIRAALRLVVPRLADWCVVDYVTEEGDPRSSVWECLHRDASAEPQLGALAAATRGRGVLRSAVDVLRTGEPSLHSTLGAEEVLHLAQEPSHAAVLETLGTRSALVVPLSARGQVFGTLTLASGVPGRYCSIYMETAKGLGHRIALAVDNGRLFREAQGAVKARERFLAIVSHDLRTPLSTISMAASRLVRRSGASDEELEIAESILRSARRMGRLIRDLLDISQIEAGKLRVEPKRERLADLLRQGLECVRPLAGPRELQIAIEAEDAHLEVMCDRERVLQVLSNLLGNAIKHTAGDARVALRLGRRGDSAVVSVEDTGPGIPDERAKSLFQPFEGRADRGAPERSIGLGLCIAKGLVEAHGGEIWVETGAGSGATFSFSLPLIRPAGQTDAPVAGLPVLLVDDDAEFRREVTGILQEAGHRVVAVEDGRSAWDYLQSNPSPALVLLDLMMPIMDGWALMSAMQSDWALSNVPKVIMSGLSRGRVGPQLACADGYLEKPVQPAQLLALVQRHLGPPAQARASAGDRSPTDA